MNTKANATTTEEPDMEDREYYSVFMEGRARVEAHGGQKFVTLGKFVLELCATDGYAFQRQRALRDLLDTVDEGGGLEGCMMDFIKMIRKEHPGKEIKFDVKVEFL